MKEKYPYKGTYLPWARYDLPENEMNHIINYNVLLTFQSFFFLAAIIIIIIIFFF